MGIPCDFCQEDTLVLANAKTKLDSADRILYRRYRTCTNIGCPLYLIQRETAEIFLPLKPDAVTLEPYHHNIRASAVSKGIGIFPPRTTAFPTDLVPPEILAEYASRPSINEEEARLLVLVRQRRKISIQEIKYEMRWTPEKARRLLLKLLDLGLIGKSAAQFMYEPVPDQYIPANVRLPPELQRSAS